ncbi:MAG: AraC family transcriptional regulator [Acidobacteria bacterium]|nr:AraC family transcriptional regulator [Acidobacteriota bacterium]
MADARAVAHRSHRRLARHQPAASRADVRRCPDLTRLARFLRACRRLRHAPDARLTGVAHDAGFYDQAHFIHEFRAFSGMTPGEFAASPRVSALDVE